MHGRRKARGRKLASPFSAGAHPSAPRRSRLPHLRESAKKGRIAVGLGGMDRRSRSARRNPGQPVSARTASQQRKQRRRALSAPGREFSSPKPERETRSAQRGAAPQGALSRAASACFAYPFGRPGPPIAEQRCAPEFSAHPFPAGPPEAFRLSRFPPFSPAALLSPARQERAGAFVPSPRRISLARLFFASGLTKMIAEVFSPFFPFFLLSSRRRLPERGVLK